MKVTILTLMKKGGMLHYTSQLANNLSKFADVSVIIPENYEGNYFNKKINIKTINVPENNGWITKKNFEVLKLPKIIQDTNPDILHISGSHEWLIPLYFLLKFREYKINITLHDINPHVGERTIIKRLVNYFYVKIADHIFVHGKNLKDELIIKGYAPEKISVIKLGNFSFITEYGDKRIKEDGSILFFGRIEEYKGLIYLLESLNYIKKEIPNIKLIIAGRGNLKNYSNYINNNNNIQVINKYIEDSLVAELFRRSSVIILPYIEGSQTGIIPIAYAFKKPVIVTNVGSIPESVLNGITGFIVPPRDSKMLAARIIQVLNDDNLRSKMSENAYNYMKTELSWETIAKKTFKIYGDQLE